MYTLLLVLIYLAFISLGLPDSLLGSGWPVMHGDLQVPVSYMGIVTMIHLRRYGGVQPVLVPADEEAGHPGGDGGQRVPHRRGAAGVLLRQPVLDAAGAGGALRPGGRGYRRRAEQLCGPALHLPAHELAPLFLGGWGPL